MSNTEIPDVPMEDSASRRGSVFSLHSSVSSVEGTGAWKKRKREDDAVDDYRQAFVNVRSTLEQDLLKDKAKLSRATIGLVLDHFSRVESIFMDAFAENIVLKAQVKILKSLGNSSSTTQPNHPQSNLPPLHIAQSLGLKTLRP